MTAGRLLAVGDIHGCRELLAELLDKVTPQPEDQLIFLGDYIDRGPDSRGVIDELLDIRQRYPQTILLKGNHEAMFLEYLDGTDSFPFLLSGGAATLNNYQQDDDVRIPPEHLDFLQKLRLFYETEEFIFVHAGLRPGLGLAAQQEQDLLWIRAEFLESNYDWGKTIVFGHTPLAAPLLTQNRIGLDTGAVFGRVLTCCEVRSRRCWHSP